jgi:hypothetical protein
MSAQVDALLVLQSFQVLFLALHDWVQLGRLNDVRAVRSADPLPKLVIVTVISTLPFAFGLAASIASMDRGFPTWLIEWLRISYALLFLGQIRAWWIPYLVVDEPARASRYQVMFGRTHAFLPVRHGITPNTLHVLLHLATVATLILLW